MNAREGFHRLAVVALLTFAPHPAGPALAGEGLSRVFTIQNLVPESPQLLMVQSLSRTLTVQNQGVETPGAPLTESIARSATVENQGVETPCGPLTESIVRAFTIQNRGVEVPAVPALESIARAFTVSSGTPTDVVPFDPSEPVADRLYPVTPNPMFGHGEIRFDLRSASSVFLAVFDLAGRRVCWLANSPSVRAGRHLVRWNGRDESGRTVSAGIYFVRLQTAGSIQTGRVVVLAGQK